MRALTVPSQVHHLAALLRVKVAQARKGWQRQRQATRAKKSAQQSGGRGDKQHGLHLPWRRHHGSEAHKASRWARRPAIFLLKFGCRRGAAGDRSWSGVQACRLPERNAAAGSRALLPSDVETVFALPGQECLQTALRAAGAC